jgi:hypothetical protein
VLQVLINDLTLIPATLAATQIAVLKETEGKGPYCSLVMAVVVVKDVLLFAAFAVNVELFKAVSWAAPWCGGGWGPIGAWVLTWVARCAGFGIEQAAEATFESVPASLALAGGQVCRHRHAAVAAGRATSQHTAVRWAVLL